MKTVEVRLVNIGSEVVRLRKEKEELEGQVLSLKRGGSASKTISDPGTTHLMKDNVKLKEDNRELRTEMSTIKSKQTTSSKTVKELEARCAGMARELGEARAQLAALKRNTEDMCLEEKDQMIEDLVDENMELKEKLEVAKAKAEEVDEQGEVSGKRRRQDSPPPLTPTIPPTFPLFTSTMPRSMPPTSTKKSPVIRLVDINKLMKPHAS